MQNEVSDNRDEAAGRLGRRTLLGAGIGGAALSLLPFLGGRVSASADSTTTAPPQRPTDSDVALLAAAQQVELTAQELYSQALTLAGWSAEEQTVMVEIHAAHAAYAQSLSGMLGNDAPGAPLADLKRELLPGFTGSTSDALGSAAELESALVATHLDLIGRLQGTRGAALIASIQIAEAQHCTALAHLAGATDTATLLVDTEAAPIAVEA